MKVEQKLAVASSLGVGLSLVTVIQWLQIVAFLVAILSGCVSLYKTFKGKKP